MKKRIMGLVGMITMVITAITIGYVIGDNYGLDSDLLGQLLLVYAPPIICSITMTSFVIANKVEKVKEVVEEES